MSKEVKELKIRPEYFKAVVAGEKTFEIRFNDRDYQVGDVLRLWEYDGECTGRTIEVMVRYILENFAGLTDGYVAMSIGIL